MNKLKLFRKKKEWEHYPIIEINNKEANGTKNFPTNKITTTKYTVYTFIPKNLFEKRHQSDKQINNVLFEVWDEGGQKFVSKFSKHLQVGDFVKISCDQPIPSDILLLSSPIEEGTCFTETSQLDGETNLKAHKALAETNIMGDDVIALKGQIEAEIPSADLYKFRGKITLSDGRTLALNERHLMLRGEQIRNTPYIIGVVIYAGKDTKLSLNSKNPPSKFSTVERRLNRCVIGIFCFEIICVILLVGLSSRFIHHTLPDSPYLWNTGPYEKTSAGNMILKEFFTYFALLSFLIPMSLMVTLEVVKISQVQFMEWDVMMSEYEGTEEALEVKKHEKYDFFGRKKFKGLFKKYVKGRFEDKEKSSEKGASGKGKGKGKDTNTEKNEVEVEKGVASRVQVSTERSKEAKKARGMAAKTSNLNDELGLVKYVFSDKTGTLTENHMEFSKCSIGGVVYEEAMNGQLRGALLSPDYTSEKSFEPIREFLVCLALCHAALPALKDGQIVYQSQSPDEVALCDAARVNAFEFAGRSNDGISVSIFGENHIFLPLATLEFNSNRRRMSVIVRTPDGRMMLYCKGADSVMMELLRNTEDLDLVAKTREDLTNFSKDGLRTLVLGCREISQEEWDVWFTEFHDANIALENREERLESVYAIIERDLRLIGATAIEDRLQDGVPETIEFLLKAGIRVWMITGDKQETAINIGYACRLLSPDLPLVVVNAATSEECKQKLESALIGRNLRPHADERAMYGISMAIDGPTLMFALHEHAHLFLRVAGICRSVICCRTTPLQKALVVKTVKTVTNKVCLAIGDGANDVSMIQEANIGVGIFGKEGTQAARSSDYALLRFRHLARLIAVHGRYSMLRNTSVIKYSLYKNVAFFFVQFWFSFYSGYSGQTLYDDWIVTTFNLFFTSIPPYFMALFEKDIDEDLIMKYPQLYRRCQSDSMFTYTSVAWWVLNGVFHSFLFFYGTLLLYHNGILNSHGIPEDLATIGFIASSFGIVVVILKAALETRYWNWIVHAGIWGSLVMYVFIACVDSGSVRAFPVAYFVFYVVLGLSQFYLVLILMTFGCLLPDFTIKFLRHSFVPQDWHILRERRHNRMPDLDEHYKEIQLEFPMPLPPAHALAASPSLTPGSPAK